MQAPFALAKHVPDVRSQQFTPPVTGGQLFWQSESLVHAIAHIDPPDDDPLPPPLEDTPELLPGVPSTVASGPPSPLSNPVDPAFVAMLPPHPASPANTTAAHRTPRNCLSTIREIFHTTSPAATTSAPAALPLPQLLNCGRNSHSTSNVNVFRPSSSGPRLTAKPTERCPSLAPKCTGTGGSAPWRSTRTICTVYVPAGGSCPSK